MSADATNPTQPQTYNCPRCGQPFTHGTLACAACGALIYRDRLQQLSQYAQSIERTNPPAAAMAWHECLTLLPPDSQQYQTIRQRVGALAAGMPVTPLGYGPPPAVQPTTIKPPDTWQQAIFKTGGSMLLSIVAYAFWPGGWGFAVGFTLLILVHELGHSLAMWRYKLSASPPIFIPFLGAVINLRQPPPNAKVEAIVGIAGPVLGSIAALVPFVWYLLSPNDLALELAFFGFYINLWNLIPVPPLDGGRVAAALSPMIWVPGVLAMIGLMIWEFKRYGDVNPIMLIILLAAVPRILYTLSGRAKAGDYYKVSRSATLTIGAVYVVLGVSLIILSQLVKSWLRARGAEL